MPFYGYLTKFLLGPAVGFFPDFVFSLGSGCPFQCRRLLGAFGLALSHRRNPFCVLYEPPWTPILNAAS